MLRLNMFLSTHVLLALWLPYEKPPTIKNTCLHSPIVLPEHMKHYIAKISNGESAVRPTMAFILTSDLRYEILFISTTSNHTVMLRLTFDFQDLRPSRECRYCPDGELASILDANGIHISKPNIIKSMRIAVSVQTLEA